MATIEIEQDGKKLRTSASFYRGEHTNFYPTDESLATPDGVADYLVKGWMPSQPFVDKATPIVAFGSCFAENISNYLARRGFNVLTKREGGKAYVTQMGDGITNTFAVAQQFQWAWEGRQPRADLWFGYDAQSFGYDEDVRTDTRQLFDQADVFIITLGVAEVWYDEPTGEVFWRAVPMDKVDPKRHKFRVTTVAENKANLHEIRRLIRRYRPNASIILTVSPIPLRATFRPVACISANSVSKGVLRVAVDEFVREVEKEDPHIHYFPSYELALYGFDNQWTADRRHLYPHVLDFNMKIFEAYFCRGEMTPVALQKAYAASRRRDIQIARKGHPMRTPEQQAAYEARRKARIAQRMAERQAQAKAGQA
jgi:GSCFA family